jgi:acyl-CoA synthetase (AMP-forming)/AMP-acid ligase II
VIVRGPYPDIEIPNSPLTPFVLRHAERLADKPAIVDGPSGRTLTYGQLSGAVRALAAGLAKRGFGKGDVFGLFAPNVPEYAIAYHGIATAGGLSTTINSLYTADDVAFQLHDAGARFLLTVPPFLDRALPAAEKAGIEEVFVLGEAEGATPFASLLDPSAPAPEVDLDPADDLVVLPYSSGTTGFPKGVMLTHRNLVANLLQTDGAQGMVEDDVVMGILPFFHIYGQVVVMNFGLYHGATIVTMPKFELEPFLDTMQRYRVTRGFFVPPIILALAKHPAVDGYDLSSLKTIFSGAAPLGADLAEACASRLGCKVMQGYGLTETSPVTHSIPSEGGPNKPGSIGPPLASTEARVVDYSTGEDLGTDEDGEVLIRGPQVMRGYLNNPEATAMTIDEDGWLHTGDIGHHDEDGYFFIVDRLKELIKYKAYQVPPAELEAVLLTHPCIVDAAVVPSPDEEAGEIPKAFVVLKSPVTEDEVMAFVAERVAPQKKVRAVEFVDEIPKSASGKILRRVLVQRERERMETAG